MPDSPKILDRDLRRTILLGAYIKHWGIPASRTCSSKGDEVVEVYYFPAGDESRVSRFATVGASGVHRADARRADFELLFVLPENLGGATAAEVTAYILDVFAYALRADVLLSAGHAIPPTQIAPLRWPTKALLIDLPRGEPEDLETLHVGRQHVNIFWVVPIYAGEYEVIRARGVEVFFAQEERSEFSLVDPHRPPLVGPVVVATGEEKGDARPKE